MAIDKYYFRTNILLSALPMIWPLIWLPYFSVSKRVKKVFQTHDWEPPFIMRSVVSSPVTSSDTTTPTQPVPVTEIFNFNFNLAPEEFDEAVEYRGSLFSGTKGKKIQRMGGGIAAICMLLFPNIINTSWTELIKNDPVSVFMVLTMLILSIWTATGSKGIEKLNRKVNRLDVERYIRCTADGVNAVHGATKENFYWSQCLSFQETPNLFILNTTATQFWTIPKRLLSPEQLPMFRALLMRKLKKK